MKISELMERAKFILETHGDIEVYCQDYDYDDDEVIVSEVQTTNMTFGDKDTPKRFYISASETG